MNNNNNKIVTFSPEARDLLAKGVNTLADAVKSTLGPKGRNVIIQSPYGTPMITKDGVTVASHIKLVNPIENLGAAVVMQAASKTAKIAGDGTTTATVIAQALVNEARELLNSGMSPIDIKRAFESHLTLTLKRLHEEFSKPVEDSDILSIAKISSNNDPEIGALIEEAFNFVGREGLIMVEDSKTDKTYVSTVDGAQIKSPILSPYFVTDPVKLNATYEDAFVLVTDKKLRAIQELVPLLNQVAEAGAPLLIIADEVEGQVLNTLILNKVKYGLKVVAIKAPAYSDRRAEILRDIAILTGTNLITDLQASRLEDIKLSDLGKVSKVIVDKDTTLLVGPHGDPHLIKERIETLNNELSSIQDPSTWPGQKLSERIAALQGKIAVLYIGAHTEAELTEKKHRVDDALRATKSSIIAGYVPGGGVTLYNLRNTKIEPTPTSEAWNRALSAPIQQILSNAGCDVSEILSKIDKSLTISYGYDASNYEYADMIKVGIIDPTLVVHEALTNGVSAANMIVLSEVTIHNEDQNFYSPGSVEDMY